MKRFFQCLALLTPFILNAQDSYMSDYASYCKDITFGRQKQNEILGFTAGINNGVTYVFRYITDKYCEPIPPPLYFKSVSNGCPVVYTFDPSDGSLHYMDLKGDVNGCHGNTPWIAAITNFSYPDKWDYTPDLLSKLVTFNYNGRTWLLQIINSKDKKSCYECFAEIPLEDKQKAFTYVDISPIPTGNSGPEIDAKLGAFQLGDSLYFVTNKVSINKMNYEDKAWKLETYALDTASNKFIRKSEQALTGQNLVNGNMLAGMARRYDSKTGRDYFLLVTYVPVKDNAKVYFYRLDVTKGTGKVKLLGSIDAEGFIPGGVVAVPGSVQAKRQPAQVNHPEMSDRLSLFSIRGEKVGSGYPIDYYDIYISSDSIVDLADRAMIINPIGNTPKMMDNYFSSTATYTIEPNHYTDKLSTSPDYADGFQMKMWLFFPDTKQDIFAVGFNSDIWQPSPSPYDTVVTSSLQTDTGNVSRELQGLSTLVGIIDGGPPCSVNWEQWDSVFPVNNPRDPTILELSQAVTQQIEYTNSTTDEFTTGANMKFMLNLGIKNKTFLSVEEGVGFHYVNAFKQLYSTGIESVSSSATSYPLSSDVQGYGHYLWAYPIITRYVYRRYVWWDAYPYLTYAHPVPNTLQYLFRNRGMDIGSVPVPIQGNPFRVDEPNGIGLRDWTIDSVSYGHRGRYEIFKVLTNNSTLSRLTHASWIHGEEPINGSFESITDSAYLSESENTFKIKTSAGLSLPEIFKLKASVGYDISYTTEVRHTVKFGSEIHLKLNINQSVAPYLHNPQSLNMDLYLFSPEDGIDYWYWDSIPNTSQRPWYIAYVVKGASKSIALHAPPDQYVLKGQMPEFYWQTEGMEKDASCSLFIASGWPMTPANVLYEESTGVRTASFVSGFVPEPGKTYYWAVRGVDGPGEITWSDPRTFTVAKDDPVEKEQAGLMAIVYPNPSTGHGIHVSMLGRAGDDVRVSLYSMEGTLICAGQYEGTGPGETDLLLPCSGLAPGIYLVEITTLRERLVKKLVII